MDESDNYSPKSPSVDRAIGDLARRQGGHVTREQLLALGLAEWTIRYRVKKMRLIPIYAGVYAVGHRPVLPIARAAGALLACGPGAVLSHGSAATLWDMAREWEFPFELTVPRDRRPKGLRVHHSIGLTRRDVRIQLGLRVTSPARTVLDLAPALTTRRLEKIINDARLASYLRLGELCDLIERCLRHPGAKQLRSLLERQGAPTRSEFERVFVAFTERFGLPRPRMNAIVAGYEVDALFDAQRLIVELDGYETHSDRRTFERDRDKDAHTLLAGYGTVRVTWRRLAEEPGAEARRLQTLLEQRGRSR